MTFGPAVSSPAEDLPVTHPARREASDARLRGDLRRVIADGIIPRLRTRFEADRSGWAPLTPMDVATFANLTLTAPGDVLLAHIQAIAPGGVGLERVILDLIAPAARHLGDLWLSDQLSFVAVTRGTSAMQALVRMLGPSFERRGGRSSSIRSILLASVAGEQHVFGLSVLASFFRRAGWLVAFDACSTDGETAACLASRRFDAVGVSASGTRYATRVPDLVERLRRKSANPDIVVLVGGGAIVEQPGLIADVKPDALACDALDAVRAATSIVSTRSA